MAPRVVAVVPHTHWDREWYEPFERFRLRLVDLFDGLLDLLHRDPAYARFLLDGQTVVLDDYLEVRPERAPEIAALVRSGRVSIGPWECLMDEAMVSGETLVRNLRRGVARAADFGGAMPVGYLPDMFTHVAQMPQILRLAGFGHAVLWRGVPAAVDRTAFWWEAPDGSRVRTEHLYGSYANGRDLPGDPAALVERARSYEAELGSRRFVDGGLLLMNGTDHRPPQPGLGGAVEAANTLQDDYRFTVTSLPEYLATQPVEGLPVWRGELRSGATANVLMGVASNRVDVHQAGAAAERAVERLAEPLAALFGTPDDAPAALLDRAWRLLVLNSAHDSACACSHDDVVEAVRHRHRETRHLADALVGRVVGRFAGRVGGPVATVVCNPTAVTRSGTVELEVVGDAPVHHVADDGTPCATQVVGTVAEAGVRAVVVGEKVRWVADLVDGDTFAGTPASGFTRAERPDGAVEYVVGCGEPDAPTVDLADLRVALLADGARGATVHLRQDLPVRTRVAVAVPPVPGFGWRSLRRTDGYGPGTALAAGPDALANAHLRVDADPRTGTFRVETADGVTVVGAGRLVEGGDGGDTYNYSPPAVDRIVDAPVAVTTMVTETGPVRARLEIVATYEWPTHAVGDHRACSARSATTVPTEVRTTLELRADERFVRVHTELDHRVRDHRVRVHVPLPAPVTGSDAECAFAVVRRGLTAEGGPHEAPLPTFVSRRFVDASDGTVGCALLHDGLLEYEVVDDGRTLALTLLRATGWLSRVEPALRPNPAGPPLATPGAQLPQRLAFDWAVLPHRGDWTTADLHAAADEFLVPLPTGPSAGTGTLPPAGSHLTVSGAVVSAVVPDPAGTVLRVFNPLPTPVTATVERAGRPVGGTEVDLLDRPVHPFPGVRDLGPAEIVSLRLA